MITLFVHEDITPGVQRQKDWETPGGIGLLPECMFMGQRYDIGVIYVTHTLSGTSPIIRQNAETIIATNLSGENPRLICDMFNVTPEQADRTKSLRRGEFVILNPVLWEKCVFATFEKPQIPGMLEESQRQLMAKNILKRIRSSAPAPMSKFRPTPSAKADAIVNQYLAKLGLSSLHLEMLMRSSTGVRKPICKIYNEMGLSRAQGRRITKRLESIGTVIPHSLPTGKPGGRLCFYETTDYGWDILTKRGITKPKSKTNGTFVHELAVNLIEAWERKRSRAFRCEVNVGGKRLDCESTDKTTGAKTIWNIGVSDPVREAESIEAILKLLVVRTSNFVFVARNTRFAKEVSKLLTDKDPSGKLLSRVEIKTIADFVEV